MASLFDLTSFSGSLEVTSTEPIVSLSLNFEADPVFSSLPPGESDASEQGSTIYYFPHLAVGASWQNTITYINDSPQEVTCQTDFISDYGNPLTVSFPGLGTVASRTDVLPPGGSVHEETNVELNAALAPGWAQATCSGPVKASLLFRRFNGEGMPMGEAGVNASAAPALRFITFAEEGEGKTGTGVAYANPSPTSALVTLTAKDAPGQILASVNRSLPPGGHEAQNMASLSESTTLSPFADRIAAAGGERGGPPVRQPSRFPPYSGFAFSGRSRGSLSADRTWSRVANVSLPTRSARAIRKASPEDEASISAQAWQVSTQSRRDFLSFLPQPFGFRSSSVVWRFERYWAWVCGEVPFSLWTRATKIARGTAGDV